MPWQDVCLSVRPAVMPVLCVNGYAVCISSKFFRRRVAPPFWFFHTKRDRLQYSNGDPLTGAPNAAGVKIGTLQHRATVTMEGE